MNTLHRLTTIDPGLDDLLQQSDAASQIGVARLAAEKVTSMLLDVPEAADMVRTLGFESPDNGARSRIEALADVFDDRYFTLEEDAGRPTPASTTAFRQASALWALSSALRSVPLDAARDAVYDAYFALGEDATLLESVRRFLAATPDTM